VGTTMADDREPYVRSLIACDGSKFSCVLSFDTDVMRGL
jgi:hypothetical protein